MGRALRRALATSDAIRINSNVPLIADRTELITPAIAEEMLKRNDHNRPVNWKSVERYADVMARGEWKLHAQGIILDAQGNILTGQSRLWAVVYSGVSVYFRVSRGSPAETAALIDRGRPQSARDLSSRVTQRRHSPIEASLARCVCILRGKPHPGADEIAAVLTEKDAFLSRIIGEVRGTNKTKAVLMILGAFCNLTPEPSPSAAAAAVCVLADELDRNLHPYSAATSWGKGAAFGMALSRASQIVRAWAKTIGKEEKDPR